MAANDGAEQHNTRVHQAQVVEMEILAGRVLANTVSRRRKGPAPDTLTTFQNGEMTRCLIERNTKGIIPI